MDRERDVAGPDLRCYYHPDREATSQCDRCGDYLCAECVQRYAGLEVCGRCRLDLLPVKRLPRVVQAACGAGFIAGLFWLFPILFFLGLDIPDEWDVVTYVIISAGMSLFAFVTCSAGAVWGAIGSRWLHASVVLSAALSLVMLALVYGIIDPDVPFADEGYFGLMLGLSAVSLVLGGLYAWKKVRPRWVLGLILVPPVELCLFSFLGLWFNM